MFGLYLDTKNGASMFLNVRKRLADYMEHVLKDSTVSNNFVLELTVWQKGLFLIE